MLAETKDAFLAAMPRMRAFAISLTGDVEKADDLVQEALLRALNNLDKFEPGTNAQAWLFTILRNQFHSNYRKRRREVEDPDGIFASKLAVSPVQTDHLDFEDFRTALGKLSDEHREAILLIGAEGLSYEETAKICGVPVGTIKSRVNRARVRLAQLLAMDNQQDLGPERQVRAALGAL